MCVCGIRIEPQLYPPPASGILLIASVAAFCCALARHSSRLGKGKPQSITHSRRARTSGGRDSPCSLRLTLRCDCRFCVYAPLCVGSQTCLRARLDNWQSSPPFLLLKDNTDWGPRTEPLVIHV